MWKTLLWLMLGLAPSSARPAPPITYIDQPSRIVPADYVAAWPSLAPYIARLGAGSRAQVKADLQHLAGETSSAGALNLLAQLEREDGQLDESEAAIERAIRLEPKQHRHYFQLAMVLFARLTRASGLGRWRWHRRTVDAYQKAFDLDPSPAPYRIYLIYGFLNTPGFAGGDMDLALRLADDGVKMGEKEFYVVRADVHRMREENAASFSDYDRAIEERIFKLSSFLSAARFAMEREEWLRVDQYTQWAVHCRPDDPRTHEALGDYYLATGDIRAAASAFEEALRIDPQSSSAREKLARSRGQK